MGHKKKVCSNCGEILKEEGYLVELKSLESKPAEQSLEASPIATKELMDPQIQISDIMGKVNKETVLK